MTTELPNGDPGGEASYPKSAAEILALEQQFTQVQAGLEEYQRPLNDLPGIDEDKFRQKVYAVAQEIRHFLDERKALQEQVAHALPQPRIPEALPAVPLEPAPASRSRLSQKPGRTFVCPGSRRLRW